MTTSKDDPLIGTRIREYQITEVLGKGGMGAVYRARHVYLDEDRAIKVIQGRLAGDADFVERFIREARILTKLRHPNLVQLYEFGTLEQDTFFMVLEFIQGESVIQRIKRLGRINVPDSIKIIKQAALGLNSAHSRGIIHRDISPDNLILLKGDDDGKEVTKVIDFGIAKPLFESSSQHFTVTNLFIGKPEYCSPEQCGLMEEGEIIDARSDIYSLGVTMYHMIAGRLPFYSPTPQGYLLKHANEIPKPVSSFVTQAGFPQELDRVLLKALAKRREDRYASMEEFIQDLDGALPSEMAATAEITSFPRLSSSDLRPGELFARRYLIERKLGQGGMGAVYKALDRILEVPVALKIMSQNIVQDEKTVERFKREVILARKVAHPNACRIFDMGESTGIHYVSMEFLEGNTLFELLRSQGPLTPDVGLPLIKQALQALQEAHRVGIVHRDLKPQNIMVDLNMKAHIMDFGISISSEVHRVTQTGALIGTPHYMAPEQFEGKTTDLRADIYSIGVIMFEMFTGRLPFEADTPVAIIFAHLKSDPPRPSEINSGIPHQLDRIILKALQKEVKSRYQNVRELLQDFEPLLAPSTTLGAISREQIAHKLIAEQSYSKAIKFLNHLVKNDPDNKQWKRLLNTAATEKINRDIRRVKHLLHKKNLIQAQLLVEKIHRYRSDSTRVTNQIKKLESRLNTEREQAIEIHLKEAESLIEQKNYSAAMASLESAWNLKQNDPRVVQLQEKVQSLQQEEYERNLQTQLDEAKAMLHRGDAKVALTVVEDLLKESPTFQPAMTLHSHITEVIRIKTEEEKLRVKLDSCLQAFFRKDFDQCALMLEILTGEAKEEAFKKELHRIQRTTRAIAAAARSDDFEELSVQMRTLLKEDPIVWLKPHHASFAKIQSEADQKAAVKRQFRSLFEKAKAAYDGSQWEEAIELWEEALKIQPKDPLALELVTAARKQLEMEQRILTKLNSDVTACEKLLKAKRFTEAKALLDGTEESLALGYRAEDLQRRITELRKELEEAVAADTARQKALQNELSDIQSLYDQTDYASALDRIERFLQQEPNHESALVLRTRIQKSMGEHAAQAQKFKSALDRGQQAFQQQHWEDAIAAWEQALRIFPSDKALEQSVSEARKHLQTERQIQAQIRGLLKEFDKLFAGHKYSDAQKLLDQARQLCPADYGLRESREQIQELQQKLDFETEKETLRLKTIGKEIAESAKLFKKKEYDKALQRLEQLLLREPNLDEAVKLRSEIQSAYRTQEIAELQKMLDQLQWEKAIERTESALQVLPGDVQLLQKLSDARSRLLSEVQLRERIAADLKECEQLFAAGKYVEADQLAAKIQKSFPAGFRLPDLQQQLKTMRQKLQIEIERERTRLQSIQKELAEIDQLYQQQSLQAAFDRVSALLVREPTLPEAVRLKENIQKGIQEQEKISASFHAAFEKGKSFFDGLRWEEAIAAFQKAYEIIADPGIHDWIRAAESRLTEQRKLRSEITIHLSNCEKLIEQRKFGEARALLDSIRQRFSGGFYLEDLEQEAVALNQLWDTEVQKENARKKAIEKSIADATKLFEKEAYQDALVKVETLLQQDPELQSALALRTKIQAILNERDRLGSLKQQLDGILRLVDEERLQDLSVALKKLEAGAQGSSYEKEANTLAEDLLVFSSALQAGDPVALQKRYEKLMGVKGQLRLSEAQLRLLKAKLAERERRETEFSRLLQEAIAHYQARRWDQSLAYFQRLSEMNPEHPQVKQYLPTTRERAQQLTAVRARLQSASAEMEKQITAGKWDEAIHTAGKILRENFAEFPVEVQITQFKDRNAYAFAARTKNTLEEAARTLQGGHLDKAKQLYEKVLSWEPSNATAQLGVRQIESAKEQASGYSVTGGHERVKRPLGIPLPVWVAVPLVLLAIAMGIWYATRPAKVITTAPPPPAFLTAPVTINALPWARVKLTPLSNDIKMPKIADEELVTPCNITLPPGEYELELDNGLAQMKDKITVSRGTPNEFTFYIMGEYDPQAIVDNVGGKQ